MGSAGLQWDVSDVLTAARLNQKNLFVGTGVQIAGLTTTYAGQLAFCTSTGSGFTAGYLYERNAANTAWKERIPRIEYVAGSYTYNLGSWPITYTTGANATGEIWAMIFKCEISGSVRTYFEGKVVQNTATAAVTGGTSRTLTTTWQGWTEDISGGQYTYLGVIALSITTNGSGNTASVRNFYVKGDEGLVVEVKRVDGI